MSTDLRTSEPVSLAGRVRHFAETLPVRLFAAALCLAVVLIHVIDQGGFPGSKEPGYVGLGYYLLEAGGVIAAVLLATGVEVWKGWFLAPGWRPAPSPATSCRAVPGCRCTATTGATGPRRSV